MCLVIWIDPLQHSHLPLLQLSQTHTHKVISCICVLHASIPCQYLTSAEFSYTLPGACLSIIHIEEFDNSRKVYSCNTFIHSINMRK